MSAFARLWRWPTRQRGRKKARRPALGVEVLEGRRVLSAAPTPPPIGPTSIPLIQSSSLSGWSPSTTNWTVNNSVLTCSAGGPSIVTTQNFSNFNFHAEFSAPAKANSGFFLRDCYEIQVLDSQWRDVNGNPAPANCTTGSIYSLIAPSQQIYVGTNQWTTLDATLVGTSMSVWLNSVLVIDQQTVTRASRGAGYPTYDSGPILIQAYEPNQFNSTVGLQIRNLYVTPLPAPPATPTALGATAVGGGVNLSWAAPAYDGGSPVADYSIQYSSNGGTSWSTFSHAASTSTSATVTGLSVGTSYVFRVAAVSSAGTGSYTAQSSSVVPATTPGVPASLAATAGNGQVSLSWIAPASTGGSPVTDYSIQYSSDGGTNWSTFGHTASTSTSASVTGLSVGTSYVFRVAAVNSAGTGSYAGPSAPVVPTSAVTDFNYTIASGQVTITGYKGSGGVVVIPGVMAGLPVTSIASSAFYSCSSLTILAIPSSVTSIGSSAFSDCTGLTAITIPIGVTSIGSSAFNNCRSLTNLAIPSGVTSIAEWTFNWCRGLTSLTLPSGVTRIGDYAFQSCSSLTSLVIPSSVTSIGSSAFTDCSSLTGITIPVGVTSIGSSAFSDCTGLTAITIPAGITSIGSSAFNNCRSLTGLTIPVGVTSIGSSAFSDCTGLTAITIPVGVTSIGSSAFNNCRSLTSLTIPVGVTSIADWAFNWCRGLTSLTLPSGVTRIGDYAFQSCSSLTSLVIPSGVTSIGSSAFTDCSSLAGITIPVGVTSIGSSAFEGCRSLTSIVIPTGVRVIDARSFFGCSGLVSVSVPASLIDIRQDAFSGCTGLVNITNSGGPVGVALQGEAASIGSGAFYSCFNLLSVAIPAAATSIGGMAFEGCRSLTSIVIPTGVRVIDARSFFGCSGLVSVSVPEGVTSLGNDAFSQCTGLTAYTLPSSLTSIGSGAFFGCVGLTTVTLPSGVASIGGYAFSGCIGLTTVTLPYYVTNIGDRAFSWCTSLTRIYFAGNAPTSIGIGLFDGVPATIYSLVGTTGWTNPFAGLPVVLATIPQMATGLTATAGNGSVALSWVAPADNGGNAITDYSIQYSSNGGTSWSTFSHAASTSTSATVIGLTNTTSYVFRVASKNLYGTSPYTDQSAAVKPTDNPKYTWTDNGHGITITKYVGSETYVVVPQIIDGRPVTEIGEHSFGGLGNIVRVELPFGITRIGNSAFEGCGHLAAVNIPDSVTAIGDSAFIWCGSLETLTIPASVASIGIFWSFWGCGNLTSISVDPANTIYASQDGILYNKELTWLYWCPWGKYGAVTLPETVKTIGYFSFESCRSVTSIVIPASVTVIEGGAFDNCSSLASVAIPSGVASIGDKAFSGCIHLQSVYFGGNAPKVDGQPFQDVPGTIYYLAGKSGWTSSFAGLPSVLATISQQPTRLFATAGDGSVALSWAAPASSGGSAITDYSIQYSSDGGANWSTFRHTASTSTLATVTGLNVGIGYIFRVAAVNSAGTGSYSGQTAASPYILNGHWYEYVAVHRTWEDAKADAESRGGHLVTITTAQEQAYISAIPRSGGSATWWLGAYQDPAASNYYEPAGGWGWVKKEQWGYTNWATNEPNNSGGNENVVEVYSDGSWNDLMSSSRLLSYFVEYDGPAAVLLMPAAPVATTADGMVALQWAAPAINGGIPITDYSIQYSSNGGMSWTTFSHTASTSTSATVTGLANGTSYVFRVAAVNVVGTGFFSAYSNSAMPDGLAPSVSIGSSKASLGTTDTAICTFTLSKPSTTFTASDVYPINGSISNFIAVSSTVYTCTFTPRPDFTGTGYVVVYDNTFTDLAGNGNKSSNGYLISFVSINTVVPPTASISSSKTSLGPADTTTYTFTLSKPSTTFTASDVYPINGSVSNFIAVSSTVYACTFTPKPDFTGIGYVVVYDNTFTDSTGNGNKSPNGYLISFVTIDTVVPPTVSITPNKTSLKAGDTTIYTFTLSKPSITFTASDVYPTNGTVSGFTAASSTVYSCTFTPKASFTGTGYVVVYDNTFTDSTGHGNKSPNSYVISTLAVDTVVLLNPTVTITSNMTNLKAGETATYTFTLSKASTNFIASDVQVLYGTLSSFTKVSSTVYTAKFTPNLRTTKTGYVRVNDGTFTDSLGNANKNPGGGGTVVSYVSIDTTKKR